MKYSIIAPCYNSAPYLDSFFRSLEDQKYRDFEVIVVDDNSSDGSADWISNYAKSSKMPIKLLQNGKNRGPGFSRNRGIAEATGEWITFVDSDDTVENDLLQRVNEIIDNSSDPIGCVVYDYSTITGDKKTSASSVYGKPGGVLPLSTAIAYVRNHAVGKFYKRKEIQEKKISFPELRRCEDVAFVCRAIDACCVTDGYQNACVYYLKEPLYNYFQRSSSLSNNSNLDEEDMVKAYRIIDESFGDRYKNELNTKSIPDLLYGGLLMMCKARKTKAEIVKFIQEYESRYPLWYEDPMVAQLGKAKMIFLTAARKRNVTLLKILADIHSRLIR